MNGYELRWLAGLLEGEGSFTTGGGRVRIQLRMTDEDIVAKAAALMGCSYHHSPSANENHKDQYACAVAGKRAEALMKRLWPLMGARRQYRIAELLAR